LKAYENNSGSEINITDKPIPENSGFMIF